MGSELSFHRMPLGSWGNISVLVLTYHHVAVRYEPVNEVQCEWHKNSCFDHREDALSGLKMLKNAACIIPVCNFAVGIHSGKDKMLCQVKWPLLQP